MTDEVNSFYSSEFGVRNFAAVTCSLFIGDLNLQRKKVQGGFDSASVRPHAKNFNKIVLNSNKAFVMSRGSVIPGVQYLVVFLYILADDVYV